MPQYLKEEVRARIVDAALDEFAARGYDGATMAEIARRADVSTGNIYRYYDDKASLFEEVLPGSFVARFRSLLRARVRASEGVEDIRDVAGEHPYAVAARAVLDYSIEHRRRVVLLLGHAVGTRYADVAEEVVQELMAAARDHFDGGGGSETRAFGLEQIYRCYVATLVAILERFEDADRIREAVTVYERYHLVGLGGFFS